MNLPRLAMLAFAVLPIVIHAQSPDIRSTDCNKLSAHVDRADCATAREEVKTIYLANATSQTEANEIMVAVRNSFRPELHIFLVTSPNALVISTYPEEFARIEAVVHSLDRPHKTFRLTYTITELDAGKTLGTEHLSIVVTDGQRTTVKEGDKIPVATGSFTSENSTAQTQFTYLDVGMNIDATVTSVEGGGFLKSKVEQSSIGQTSTIAGVTEPIVRQTVIEGETFLPVAKPVLIGSIDIPNTTRRYDIAVLMDPIK